MKKRKLLLPLATGLGLFAATAVAVAGAGTPAVRASFPTPKPAFSPWVTVAASGGVEARNTVEPLADWQGVLRGDALPPRTVLRTGARGRATLTRNGSLLIVDPKSELELPASLTGQIETSVLQNAGSVLYRVDGKEHPHFEVVTPYLVAGVKGTEFLVTVNAGYTAVTVSRGLVEITDAVTGDMRQVGEGQSLIRSRDDHEPELVDRGERGSVRARKESQRLERMERREIRDETRGVDQAMRDGSSEENSGKQVAGNGSEPATEVLGDLDAAWVGESGSEKDGNLGQKGKEDVAEELLKEMIQEEVRDGLLPGKGDDASADPGSANSGSTNPGSDGSDPGNSHKGK